MKHLSTLLLTCFFIWNTAQAQYSRLHIKTSAANTVGITTGTSTNVIGISHDGTSGNISTGSLGGGPDNTPLHFLTSDQVRMTISEDGHIGIGTDSPTSELTVAGKIHGHEIIVNIETGSGPDYVFADDYLLPSLQEIKHYINENKHLPEMPPATVMEKEGVSLGEMNMLLLKKIEELTLYAIDQQSRLEMMGHLLKTQQQEIDLIKQSMDKD